MREIMLVPLPLASSRDLMSFLTFQISTFLSACSAVSLILSLFDDCELTKTNSETGSSSLNIIISTSWKSCFSHDQ